MYKSQQEKDANELGPLEIMTKPNVVIVYAGTKFKNGVDTGQPCVVVGVKNKVHKSHLSPDDLIPARLSSGSATDVVLFPRIKAVGTCVVGATDACPPHGDRYRPLVGGISASAPPPPGFINAGTLGIVVRDSTDGSLVGLTNNHVCGIQYDTNFKTPTVGHQSVLGTGIMQPSSWEGGTEANDTFGYVKRIIPIKFDFPDFNALNTVDCGIADIQVSEAAAGILEIGGGPFVFAAKSEYDVGTDVQKSGRTTGLTPSIYGTDAKINQTNVAIVIEYGPDDLDKAMFVDQIWIVSDARFSQGGDSGSVIITGTGVDAKVIGLLFAASDDGLNTFANHIADVSSTLQIEQWDGSIVVARNAANVISVNGVCYIRQADTSDPITHSVGDTFADCDECNSQI